MLLPALLGFALIGMILIITVCLVARNKRTIVSSVRKRNRNVSTHAQATNTKTHTHKDTHTQRGTHKHIYTGALRENAFNYRVATPCITLRHIRPTRRSTSMGAPCALLFYL